MGQASVWQGRASLLKRKRRARRVYVSIDEAFCTACGLCEERAPENIELPAGAEASRIIQQPKNEEQTKACVEAANFCPTGGLQATEIPSSD